MDEMKKRIAIKILTDTMSDVLRLLQENNNLLTRLESGVDRRNFDKPDKEKEHIINSMINDKLLYSN